MPSPGLNSKAALQILAGLLGAVLLIYLVQRAGLSILLQNVKNIAWGMFLVIALAGFAHIVQRRRHVEGVGT